MTAHTQAHTYTHTHTNAHMATKGFCIRRPFYSGQHDGYCIRICLRVLRAQSTRSCCWLLEHPATAAEADVSWWWKWGVTFCSNMRARVGISSGTTVTSTTRRRVFQRGVGVHIYIPECSVSVVFSGRRDLLMLALAIECVHTHTATSVLNFNWDDTTGTILTWFSSKRNANTNTNFFIFYMFFDIEKHIQCVILINELKSVCWNQIQLFVMSLWYYGHIFNHIFQMLIIII